MCVIFEHTNLKQLDTDLDGVMTCLRNSDYRCLSSYTLPKVINEAKQVLYRHRYNDLKDWVFLWGCDPDITEFHLSEFLK